MPLTLRKLFLLSTLLLFVCLAPVSPLLRNASGQETEKPFAILITGPTIPLKTGDTCEISVTFTNITKGQVALRRDNGTLPPSLDYSIKVLDETGHLVTPISSTAHNPKGARMPNHGSFQFKRLAPGEGLQDTVRISELFDISKPGIYKIRVWRDIPQEYGGGRVDSNEIAISVVP